MPKNMLLTGIPGIGKTTLIRNVLSLLGRESATGFYTEEIREQGTRRGFRIRTLSGDEGILAHIDVKSPYRVSKYGVNVLEFERVAIPAITGGSGATARIVVIDEIGKMECFSEAFKKSVVAALDSDKTVLATIALHGDAFVESLKKRPDVTLIRITETNRDQLPKAVADELRR